MKGTDRSIIYAIHDTDVANCLERQFAVEAATHHPELLSLGTMFYTNQFNQTTHPAPFLGRFERAALKLVDLALWLMPPNSPPVTESNAYECDRRPAAHATKREDSPFPYAEQEGARFYVLPLATGSPEGVRPRVVRCAWNISETMCAACLISGDQRVAIVLHWPPIYYGFDSWPGLLATFRDIASVLLPSYSGSLE